MVGENIKRLRLANNLTQSELGEAIGVLGRTVQKYESGDISPPLDRLEKIAEVLGVELVDLIVEEKSHKDSFKDNFNSSYYEFLNGKDNIKRKISLVDNQGKIVSFNEAVDLLENEGKIPRSIGFEIADLIFKKEETYSISDLQAVYNAVSGYYLNLFEAFYNLEYMPLVKDQRIALDALDVYESQMFSLRLKCSDLQRNLDLQSLTLEKYEALLNNQLDKLSKKERLTEFDVLSLNFDLDFRINGQKAVQHKLNTILTEE